MKSTAFEIRAFWLNSITDLSEAQFDQCWRSDRYNRPRQRWTVLRWCGWSAKVNSVQPSPDFDNLRRSF